MGFSNLQQRGVVKFPEFTGERIYMREFTKHNGLPNDLKRWQETVDAMLDGVEADGPIFLMVDQSPVVASSTHRRGGLHIDGVWKPEIQAHGGTIPKHIHDCNESESIILASDVLGCAAYIGSFEGQPGPGGDCSHIDTAGLIRVDMEPGRVWAGDTLTMLHESIPVARDCLRTVVRLNVRGWCNEKARGRG